MKLVYEYFCISLWFWLRENLWLSPRKKGKRKNTRVPALDEISINVAQSRARHPVINPTLLSQFLATSLPPFPFHLYERLGKGGEREKSIETSFFFPQEKRRKPGEETAIIGGNRLVFCSKQKGMARGWMDEFVDSARMMWSIRLFHIKGTFCPALGFARWPEGVARRSARGHIGLPIGGRKWRRWEREDSCEGFFFEGILDSRKDREFEYLCSKRKAKGMIFIMKILL